MKNADKPACPDPMRAAEQSIVNQSPDKLSTGLTKRELIAAMLLQGMLAGTKNEDTFEGNESWYAEHSVKFTDELFKQLEK